MKPIHVGRRPPFHPTPFYLKLFGYKPWRRQEIVPVLFIYDASKWVYYDETDKIRLEQEEDDRAKKYGW